MLQLVVAEGMEPLAEHLAEVLADAPGDPFTPEWIAVPSPAVRRWLSLSLASRLGTGPGGVDGVSANIEWAYPGSLRLEVLQADRAEGEPDPWHVERLVWSILDVAERAPDDPVLALLNQVPAGVSRIGRAQRCAELFDRYHLHRPGMVAAWHAGKDVDEGGRPLPNHHLWQPHLWRRVREHVGTPSAPERLPQLHEQLRAGGLPVELPDRVVVFGLSVLPGGAGFLDLVRAVGATRDVLLYVVRPSSRVGSIDPSGSDRTKGNPLLRSWGRLHTETAQLLSRLDGLPDVRVTHLAPAADAPAAPPADTPTLLRRLQDDIRGDAAPRADLRFEASDRSVRFHACHGATRQVEVLRDALLHLLADEELDLTEDEILVVCPSLPRFAPLIEAVFGASADASAPRPAGRPPALRYRLTDRSLPSPNPVASATSSLLQLVAGRFDGPSLIDFLSSPPVRERYRLTDDDIALVTEWVAEMQVRWGLDPAQRATFGLPESITANSWRAAPDRLMVGAAIADGDDVIGPGDVVPYGVEGDAVRTLGRVADVVHRLARLWELSSTPRPTAAWIEILRDATASLFATAAGDEWQLHALHRAFSDVVELSTDATGEPSTVPLSFTDLTRLLGEHLGSSSGRSDYFRGGITITSTTPMRWLPHRVVCILGMDQPAFGTRAADADDLTTAEPQPGDRDARAEARQALLETILSAGERLIVIRDGHDVKTNQEVPPAVVVAELRDVLDATVHPDDHHALHRALEIHHPRQPFDERCFQADGLGEPRPWSFDSIALDGAAARRGRDHERRPFLAAPLATGAGAGTDATVIELSDLHAFLRDPVAAFLQQRLGVRLPRNEDQLSTVLPVEAQPLVKFAAGDRLLTALCAGHPVEAWRRRELLLGTLPPGPLGGKVADEIATEVEELFAAALDRGFVPGPGEEVPVDVALFGGTTRLVGTVTLRRSPDAPGPARMRFTKPKPQDRIAAWLDLMALTAAHPGQRWSSLSVTRTTSAKKKQPPPTILDLEVADDDGTAPDDVAHSALELAVDLYRRGQHEPLPLFKKTSEAVHLGKQTAGDWDGYLGFGDAGDPAVGLVFEGHDLDTLLEIPAAERDPAGTGNRVERYAHHLFGAIDRSTRRREADQQDADATVGADQRGLLA